MVCWHTKSMTILAENAAQLKRVDDLARQWAEPFGADNWPLLARDLAYRHSVAGWSVNGNSRIVSAADGWLAITLSRHEDFSSVAAWLEGNPAADPWDEVHRLVPQRALATLLERAELLGIPVAAVGEARGSTMPEWLSDSARVVFDGLNVIDLSALWAGPLCAGLLAAAGADVLRVESLGRPDPTRLTSPELHARVNGAKRVKGLDLTTKAGRRALVSLIDRADVLVTSARARALANLGLDPQSLLARCPQLVWVAITAHGWESNRVGFGDDAAVAGGLLVQGRDTPDFLGDALADPLTGIVAARAASTLVVAGKGGLLDVAMARCASYAARMSGCFGTETPPPFHWA
jgi:hypothetical protein